MNKFRKKVCKFVYSFIVFVAAISVNVTCYGRFYQDKLSPQMEDLRKYKNGK